MYNYPLNFWTIWPGLGWLYRLFVMILVAASIRFLISGLFILRQLRRVKGTSREQDTVNPQPCIGNLRQRCCNLRQILSALFYLFGFCFFVGLQGAWNTIGDGPRVPLNEIRYNFTLHFIFAENVFLVLLILHLFQWVISRRVQVSSSHFAP